jgi:hypothetical protein
MSSSLRYRMSLIKVDSSHKKNQHALNQHRAYVRAPKGKHTPKYLSAPGVSTSERNASTKSNLSESRAMSRERERRWSEIACRRSWRDADPYSKWMRHRPAGWMGKNETKGEKAARAALRIGVIDWNDVTFKWSSREIGSFVNIYGYTLGSLSAPATNLIPRSSTHRKFRSHLFAANERVLGRDIASQDRKPTFEIPSVLRR